MSWADSAHSTAHGFRRWIHANLHDARNWPLEIQYQTTQSDDE